MCMDVNLWGVNCGRQNYSLPKKFAFKFPEHVIMLLYMAKWTLQRILKLQNLRWGDYLGLSRWIQFNHMVPSEKEMAHCCWL